MASDKIVVDKQKNENSTMKSLKLENLSLKDELIQKSSKIEKMELDINELKENLFKMMKDVERLTDFIFVKFNSSKISHNVVGVDAKTKASKFQKSEFSDPISNPTSSFHKCSFIILVKIQLENEVVTMQKKKSEILESLKLVESNTHCYQQRHNSKFDRTKNVGRQKGFEHNVLLMRRISEEEEVEEESDKILNEQFEQMQLYHQNLINLEKCLNLFVTTFDKSVKMMNTTTHSQPETDSGLCQQSRVYNIGSLVFADVSTQTAFSQYNESDLTPDLVQDDNMNNITPPEAAESLLHGVTLLSRVTQTKVSSLSSSNQSPETLKGVKNNKNNFNNNNNNLQNDDKTDDENKRKINTKNSVTPKDNHRKDTNETIKSSTDDYWKLPYDVTQISWAIPKLTDMNERNVLSISLHFLSQSPHSYPFLLQSQSKYVLVELIYGYDSILPISKNIDSILDLRCFEQWCSIRGRSFDSIYNIISSQHEESEKNVELNVLNLLNDVRLYGECLLYTAIISQKKLSGQLTSNTQLSTAYSTCEIFADKTVNSLNEMMLLMTESKNVKVLCGLGAVYCAAQTMIINSCVRRIFRSYSDVLADINSNYDYSISQSLILKFLSHFISKDFNFKYQLITTRGFMEAVIRELDSESENTRECALSLICGLCYESDDKEHKIFTSKDLISSLISFVLTCPSQHLHSSLLAIFYLTNTSQMNKNEVCQTKGFLQFILSLIKCSNRPIAELSCGLFLNISSTIATNNNYLQILHSSNYLEILVEHLNSRSLNLITSSSCILYNLASKNEIIHQKLQSLDISERLRKLSTSRNKSVALYSLQLLQHLNEKSISSSSSSIHKYMKLKKEPSSLYHNNSRFSLAQVLAEGVKRTPKIRSSSQFLPFSPKKDKIGAKTSPSSTNQRHMPNGLLQKLRNANIDTYSGQDDVVDYSLKFSDTADRTKLLSSQPGPSVNPSWFKPPSNVVRSSKERTVEQRLLYVEENFHPKDMPTDFGAIYNDEVVCELPSGLPDPYQEPPSSQKKPWTVSTSSQVQYQDRVPEKPDSGAITPASHYNCRLPSVGRRSGTRTPMYQETPLVFSRSSPVSSLLSMEDGTGFQSDFTSNPISNNSSGQVSPSDLPDSPFETMPPSRTKTPTHKHRGFTIDSKPRQIEAGAKDELKHHHDDDEASLATSLSAITIDDDAKIKQVFELQRKTSPKKVLSRQPRVGYVTSLPTCDELHKFDCEGSFSPMGALSEISALRDSVAAGYQFVDGCIVRAVTSSAEVKASGDQEQEVEEVGAEVDDSDSLSFFSTSDEDDALLKRAISQGIPPKSSKSSSKSSKTFSKLQPPGSRAGSSSVASSSTGSGGAGTSGAESIEISSESKSSKIKSLDKSTSTNPNTPVSPEPPKTNNQPSATRPPQSGRTIIDYMDSIMGRSVDNRLVKEKTEHLEPTYSVKVALQKGKKHNVTSETRANDVIEDNGTVPQMYAVEDTPQELSRSTSLSTLTIESEKYEMSFLKSFILQRHASMPINTEVTSSVAPDVTVTSTQTTNEDEMKPEVNETLASNDVIKESIKDETDQDTPCDPIKRPCDLPDVGDGGAGVKFVNDRLFSFQVEDTPMRFSDNSSLSSLDIDDNVSLALLQDCISSAMPVAKVDPTIPPSPNVLLTSSNQPTEDLTPTNKPQQTPTSKQPPTDESPTNNRHYQQLPTNLINPTTSKHIDDDVFEMSSDKSEELALGGCAQTLMRKQHKKQLQRQAPNNNKLPRSIQERRKNSKLGKSHYTSKEFSASSASSNNTHCVVRPSDTVPCKRCAAAAASGRYAAASTGHLTDVVTMKTPKRRRRKTTASSTQNSSFYLPSKYQWSHSSYQDGRKYRHRHQPSFHHHSACQSGGMVKLFPPVDRNGSMLSADPIHRDEDDVMRGQQHHPLHHPAYKPCPKLLAPRKPVLKSSASASTLSEKKLENEVTKEKKKKKRDQSGSNTGKTIWKGLKKLLSNHDDTKRGANKTPSCDRVIEKKASNKAVTSHKEDESSLSLSSSDESSPVSPPVVDPFNGAAVESTSNNPPYDSSSSLSRSPTSSRPGCSYSIQKDTSASLSSDGKSSQKSPNRVLEKKLSSLSDHVTTSSTSGQTNKTGKSSLSNCPLSSKSNN